MRDRQHKVLNDVPTWCNCGEDYHTVELLRREKPECFLCWCRVEVRDRGGIGFKGWDGLNQAGDREGVANASAAADEMRGPPFSGELNGDAHQRGNAGAIDLGNA